VKGGKEAQTLDPPVEAPFSPGLFAAFLSEHVRVRDGRRLTVRPIQREDAGLLIDFHERLSPQSRYLRFFSPVPHLSPKMAEYLAGVDFVDRFALVATSDEDGVERIVAVARFDIAPDDVVAEVALVVRDDYQGVGVGTAVFGRLLEMARARGVRRLTGNVLADNRHMLQLLRNHGISAGQTEAGIVQFGLPVDDPPSVMTVLALVARLQRQHGPGV
jgi:GNAT superfamily N-acetyltransferase